MTRKDAILQSATVLFSEKGFKDTSMSEISKITGVAQGTIFYHYKNKEDLFLSILQAMKEDIIERFDEYMGKNNFSSGLDMMERAVSFYLNLAGSDTSRFLLLHRHDAYEFAEANLVCREHLEAIYDYLVDIFEQAILKGQKDGSIRDLPARKVALIIFSMVDGVARFETYKLYNAGGLYQELLESCRRILK
jgi:AcrR family transcriptional regulator